ncbi:hypothetical protein ATCC90586_003963 [Pythium insidiosum]|nr:hypothetical protein ATCC90586_003963 [Pythium insidiosum]
MLLRCRGNVDPLVADSVLCVAVDNNENFGDYIARYKEEDMTVDNAFVKNPKPASFKAVLDAVATPDLPTRSVYWPGDVVKAFAKTAAQSASGPMLLLPVTATASGKITCQGALLSAAYKIHHDGSGRITSVTALLTIGDLTTGTDEPTLAVNISHVASFGNADPFLVSEWIAIEYDAPTRSTATFQASADGVELTCANLVTSLHVELLVAPVGAANDAQDKIIAARATHGREMWHFWRRAGDATKTERFLLTTTVTFVTVRTTTLEQWIPPTPPIWFSIPNDVFYPFLLSSEASVSPLSFWAVLAVAGLSAFVLP